MMIWWMGERIQEYRAEAREPPKESTLTARTKCVAGGDGVTWGCLAPCIPRAAPVGQGRLPGVKRWPPSWRWELEATDHQQRRTRLWVGGMTIAKPGCGGGGGQPGPASQQESGAPGP